MGLNYLIFWHGSAWHCGRTGKRIMKRDGGKRERRCCGDEVRGEGRPLKRAVRRWFASKGDM